MRDSATGRSRGFGFLTFRDPKTVNTVMVKEHYLDGKIVSQMIQTIQTSSNHMFEGSQIKAFTALTPSPDVSPSYHLLTMLIKIDPKRAIPRDEQEKTSKIFVGGVSQEATEQDFKSFFTQFGRVIDATLMIDKDTGRPRGFGFVTFDSEAAVENALSRPLEILGKPIEVKKAQPRGNLRDENRGGRGGRDNYRDMNQGGDSGQQQGGQQGMAGGMTPAMMAQYWQRMQQYFAMMQQQMAMSGGNMNMGAMNPAMMQQMQQMQMKQMAAAMGGAGPQQQPQAGGMSPNPASPGAAQQAMPNMMNAAMMQQMAGQQAQPQSQGQTPSGGNEGASPGAGYRQQPGGGPGYNAQEQIAFEQQKYEQQQARRVMDTSRGYSPYQQGGPTSWEGMYDEVPQPNIPTGPQGMMGRGKPPYFPPQ